jgi:phosphatidylethanolamine-binding protein
VSLGSNYTLIMVDADYVGADISNGTYRHWLLNSVTVGSDGVVSNATATAVEGYAGPWPAAGSGAHRYCILLYQQPTDFVSPTDIVGGVVPIQLNDYVSVSINLISEKM